MLKNQKPQFQSASSDSGDKKIFKIHNFSSNCGTWVKIPVMVMHSVEDEMIPFEFGKELFDAANQPKKFVELKGGHNDTQFSSEEPYEQAWKQWLESIKQN